MRRRSRHIALRRRRRSLHPANKGKAFDFYLMFDNIAAFVTEMERRRRKARSTTRKTRAQGGD
jgi:hypothetical protein